jgi:hypothetical protein
MLNPLRKLAFAASLGAGIASFATVASALPMFDAMAIRNAAPPIVEEVQWRWGWGWGWGARRQTKLASGLLIENTMRHGSITSVLELGSPGRAQLCSRIM